jgi:hypothetical protein
MPVEGCAAEKNSLSCPSEQEGEETMPLPTLGDVKRTCAINGEDIVARAEARAPVLAARSETA